MTDFMHRKTLHIISRFDVKMTADDDGVIGGHFYIFFEQIYDGIIS